MYVTAYFSESGSPKTGLSPTVDIIDLSDNSVAINDAAMSEVGQGFYKYNFAAFDDTKDYAVICDSVTLTGAERYAIGSIRELSVEDAWTGRNLEGTLDAEEIMRIILAAVAGKVTGGNTASIQFRDLADGKDRIDASVDDDGNRTAITLDGS